MNIIDFHDLSHIFIALYIYLFSLIVYNVRKGRMLFIVYKNDEFISKQRVIKFWDSGMINKIEIGTVKGLQSIHEYLFEGLDGYEAGKIRNVNISKEGFLFASSLYLKEALSTIEKLPQNTFKEIIEKYVEMNIAHPFIEGNGRATRIWLDLILKKEQNVCVDWQKINKDDYLNFMRLSPTNHKYIHDLLEGALTDKIDDREVFMKGIDKSYEYENQMDYKMDELDK